jgi:hypothetical protein
LNIFFRMILNIFLNNNIEYDETCFFDNGSQ